MIDIRYVPHHAQSPKGSVSPFTGVFVVNTPAHDHSGISHLAEHMCFRGSPYYPADHELFVANALLPLAINATTYAGCTYFYVQSEDKALFISAIQYLYSGLTNTHFSQCAFEAERNGVLVNELTLLEGNIDYANNIAIRRNDTSPMAYQHAGGFSDSVLEISFDDLIDYKKTWYKGSHSTLLVRGADTDGNEIISLCSQAIAKVGARGFHAKSGDAMPHDKVAEAPLNTLKRETSDSVLPMSSYPISTHHMSTPQISNPHLRPTENYVSTWWVPQEFTHDLLKVESLIKSKIESLVQKKVECSSDALGHFFIDDEVNHAGMIALRFVHNSKANAQARTVAHKNVVSLLTDLNVEAKPRLFTDTKLPNAVQRLIRDFQQQTHSRYSKPHSPLKLSPFVDYLCSVHVCQAAIHEVGVKNKNEDAPINDNWAPTVEVENKDEDKVKDSETALLAANFASLLSLDNLPVLPRLLHKLAVRSTQSAQSAQNPENRFQCIGNHWVYRVDTQFHHYLIDTVTGAAFWQPRTNGECYALGVAQFNGEIFIYGAQDNQASTRDLWCKNTLAKIDTNASVSYSPA